APFTVSETGVLLYETAEVRGNNQMLWYDRGGKLLEAIGTPGPIWDPSIAPDEKSLVFRRSSGERADLWLRDLARGADQRFTTDASANATPFWSPRGDRIAFASNRRGILDLYQKAVSGAGQDQLLFANQNYIVPSQWSRDGRFIVYADLDLKTKLDLWVVP